MSLNQKYTWADFLRENPAHKEKKTKRTSSEGKKAFEAAYKKYIKGYLSERQTQLATMEKRAAERQNELTAKVKELRKAKKRAKATFYQTKVGKQSAAIASINKQMDRAKMLSKKV